MRIEHRIGWHPSDAEVVELTLLGFKLEMSGGYLVLIIDESDPRWPRVQQIVPPQNLQRGGVYTYASEEECREATWLTMGGTGPRGFPQPQDRYMSITYDGTKHCAVCGCGQQQIAPFRFRGTPKLRSMRLLQLHWVHDEFFVTPDTWATVFEPLGVACRPVVTNHDGKPIDSIVQLVIPDDPSVQIDTSAQVRLICATCGCVKHRTPRGDFWHGTVPKTTSTHLMRSSSFFGSDGMAWRLMLASQELYQRMKQHKVRGCEFEPFLPRANAV